MDEIYKYIIKNGDLSLREKLKNFIGYYRKKRGAEISWRNRHKKVYGLNNSYTKHCNREIESEHQEKWAVFRNKVDMSTIRICKNISGHADADFIPEDIFVSDIEPTLLTDKSVQFLSHKSFYNKWFQKGLFPRDIVHCVDGQYLDPDLTPISLKNVKKLTQDISYPVVMKPNWGTYGGKDIFFIENFDNLIFFVKRKRTLLYRNKSCSINSSKSTIQLG